MAVSLSVSLVTFHSNAAWFAQTCQALRNAIAHARREALLDAVSVCLIDNTGKTDKADNAPDGAQPSDQLRLFAPERTEFARASVALSERQGQGNVGYGAAHNLAIRASRADLHLVLNPDLVLDEAALSAGLRRLAMAPQTVMVGALGRDEQGEFSPLCKGLPTVAVLALRSAPQSVKRFFNEYLNAYTYAPVPTESSFEVGMVSGACMLIRRDALQSVGGFDERFFLHFEDIDLSRSLAAKGRIECVTAMRAVHYGGGAARKAGHLKPLLKSAAQYFNKYGWRWV